MPTANFDKPVLVTGATGYVAGWIVKSLLESGATVHAAVRDPDDQEKLRYLREIANSSPGNIQFFKSDLLENGSYADAMQGCEVVFHTASPFTLNVDDPQRDLVDPAVNGTVNILDQASATPSVRRVIVTSSMAAIYGDNADVAQAKNGVLTEDTWNTTSTLTHQAYSYSKTMAEKQAWKIANSQSQWELATINPSLVIGPGVNPHATSESFTLLKQFGDGTFASGVPDYGIGLVDVRDVAAAHLAAATIPAASGKRFLVNAADSSFPAIAAILNQHFGDRYPIPTRTLPKWLVWIVGPMLDEKMSRRMIANNVGYAFKSDNNRSKNELHIRYRPIETSLTEMFEQMIEHSILPASKQ